MGFVLSLLNFLVILTSLFMIALVLIQRGKGGGLAGAFGGAGGSSAFGTKAGDVFTKITIITAIVWFVINMLLVVLSNQGLSAWDDGGFPSESGQVAPTGTTPGSTSPGGTGGGAGGSSPASTLPTLPGAAGGANPFDLPPPATSSSPSPATSGSTAAPSTPAPTAAPTSPAPAPSTAPAPSSTPATPK